MGIPKMKMFCDHSGKASQARVAALASTAGGILYACAPIFVEPTTRYVVDHVVLGMLLGGPSFLALWQKMKVQQEQDQTKAQTAAPE